MIQTVQFMAGALVVALVFYDFLRTTISLAGLGPISSAVTYGLWRLARRTLPFAERLGGRGVRSLIGPLILIAVAVTWIVLHCIGYTLMYAAAASLSGRHTGEPAGLLDTVAFVGASLSTLGASIVGPTSAWWDLLSMIAAVNGMVVLTLSVSFILTILQTTASTRAFALRLHARIADLEPDDLPEQARRVAPLGSELCSLATQITASPLPGVFAPRDETSSFPRSVLWLYELLQRLEAEPPPRSADSGEMAELRWGMQLLGRQAPVEPEPSLEAACRWARLHDLD